ncbi:MAG: hypothetical protein MJ066_04305 [Clostridia bacterium]|nr:hypothetical protein [Clostridia bacterium]
MKKLINLFYLLAIVLLGVFIAFLVVDIIKYDPVITSAPFYVCIILRAVEFLLPAIIFFLVGLFLSKKIKK